MGGHRGIREAMSWNPQTERAFIEILYDSVKAGQLQTSTFSKEEWGKINQAMISMTNKDYGVDKLKGKYNRLRILHRQFSVLLEHTGVTWDPNTNTVNAPEEVWQHFFAIHKDYKILRKQGCICYETLGQIFTGTTATGKLSNPSTQLPPTSEEERQLEDDFLGGGVHVNLADDADSEDVSRSRRREEDNMSGERRHKEPRVSKADKLDACMTQWSTSQSKKQEESDLRTLYLKEKLAALQGNPSNTSSLTKKQEATEELRAQYLKEKLAVLQGKTSNASNSEANSPSQDPYSNKVCLDILNSIKNLSDEAYMKAIDKFDNPNFRMAFVEMPPLRRGRLLELL